MVRRYKMELRMVRVPIVWKAKVPEIRLMPASRRIPEKRKTELEARRAAIQFLNGLFKDVPDMFRPPELPPLRKPEGKRVEWRRWLPFSEVGKRNG